MFQDYFRVSLFRDSLNPVIYRFLSIRTEILDDIHFHSSGVQCDQLLSLHAVAVLQETDALLIIYRHISCRTTCGLPHALYLLDFDFLSRAKAIPAFRIPLFSIKILAYTVYMGIADNNPDIIFQHIDELDYIFVKIFHDTTRLPEESLYYR